MAELAAPKCEFYIFTAASINGLTAVEKEPPYEISSDNQLVGTKVYVCQYPGGAYNGLNIHDRYIIQKNELDTKGLHIGPSLDDIHNKDVSLTMFSKDGAEKALNNFESLWTECIRTKAWKKG